MLKQLSIYYEDVQHYYKENLELIKQNKNIIIG